MSRYDGKPFLRLLDCYVLSSIGHLDEKQENTLSLMAPKLSQALGFKGSWFEMVAAQMEFSSDLPVKILKIWEAGQARAKEHGVSVDPEEFARQFVDKNFSVQ
jgi:hypothetical protein